MRNSISVAYTGTWADRVAKMPDAQVVAVYQRMLNRKQLHTPIRHHKEKTF